MQKIITNILLMDLTGKLQPLSQLLWELTMFKRVRYAERLAQPR